MTRCYWCPDCGWVETTDLLVLCGHDFGFHPAVPEWRTDDDALAMALELAQVIDDDMWRGILTPVTHQVLGYNAELESSIFVWDWLREEVRNALLERAR